MKGTDTLRILQYNVNNQREKTMIPMFADDRVRDYDVIAVQERWRNTAGAIETSISSSGTGFHLLYRPGGDTRVCFFITERIDPES